MTFRRFALVAVVSAVLAALLTTAMWATTRSASPGTMMGGGYHGPMMSGYGLAGDGRRVDSLDRARQRAQAFAQSPGLRVGEVMQFSNGFYAELNTVDGHGATEVLVNPNDGSVQIEYGPAMMWNTTYGMHRGAASEADRISPSEAQTIAQRWLDSQRPGLRAAEPEQFPGYVTLHTLRDATIAGMMSVNLTTGVVWYHTWHGQYIAMSED
jgi:hypothetical protein